MQLVIALLVGFAIAQVANLCTTVYLHRTVSHKAVTMHPAAAWVFRFILWISTGLKAREWAGVHRKHHAFSDLPSDPHSPVQLGWVRVQLTNPALYRRVARDGVSVARYARDVKQDRWDKLLFDRAFIGLGLGIAALIVLLGPIYGLIAAVFHAVVYLQMSGAVNAIGHTFGKRPDPSQAATNNQWLAWLTAGEGLHNNHHSVATAAKLAFRKGEVDPGWWCIALLRALRLASVRPIGASKQRVAA